MTSQDHTHMHSVGDGKGGGSSSGPSRMEVAAAADPSEEGGQRREEGRNSSKGTGAAEGAEPRRGPSAAASVLLVSRIEADVVSAAIIRVESKVVVAGVWLQSCADLLECLGCRGWAAGAEGEESLTGVDTRWWEVPGGVM